MRLLSFILTLGWLIVLSVPAEGQAGPDREVREGDPVEMLLQIRSELQLSSDQIGRLRRVQRELEERNRPLVDRLVEVQRRVRTQLVRADSGGGSRTRPSRDHLDIARAPIRQIHANNIEAMEEVGRVLTRSQKRVAAELLDLPGVDRLWRRGRRR